MFKAQDGRVLIGFGEAQSVVELDLILPISLRGRNYDEIKANPKIGQFFELANFVLISDAAMAEHLREIDTSQTTIDKPVKTRLPGFDLDFLN